MIKPTKRNKTKVHERNRKEIREAYFNWESSDSIAKRYWYDKNAMKKYLNSRATKVYIDPKWEEWRRCSICNVYRLRENFFQSTAKYKTAHCRFCDSLKKKNQYTMLKNKWEWWKKIAMTRETWWRHKWKYNTRRRILRIIGYLDWNGRIIKPLRS